MAAAVAANKAVNAIASSLKGNHFWTSPRFASMAAGAIGGYMMSGSLLGAVAGGFAGHGIIGTKFGAGLSGRVRRGVRGYGFKGPWAKYGSRGLIGLGAGVGAGLGYGIGRSVVNSIGTSFSSLTAGAPSQVSPYGQRY